jgi:hypothetical protein
LQDKGLDIENLEDDQQQQDNILSIYHAVTHTFNATQAVKLIENHMGRIYVNQISQQPIPIPHQQPGPNLPS